MKKLFLVFFGLFSALNHTTVTALAQEATIAHDYADSIVITPTYSLTVIQDDAIIKTVIYLDNDNLWHSKQVTCPFYASKDQTELSTTAIAQLLNKNKVTECVQEEDFASGQMVAYIKSLVDSFRLLNADFQKDCPSLLKMFGAEILEFLRNHNFLVNQGELYTVALTKNGLHISLVITKASTTQKHIYATIQKIKEITAAQAKQRNFDGSIG
jgi:hypothetical protein